MGNWWDERARELQYSVKVAESEQIIDYEEEEVRTATMHTRQDMVLLVSHLSSLNEQLRTVSRFCFFILLVLILITVEMYR